MLRTGFRPTGTIGKIDRDAARAGTDSGHLKITWPVSRAVAGTSTLFEHAERLCKVGVQPLSILGLACRFESFEMLPMRKNARLVTWRLPDHLLVFGTCPGAGCNQSNFEYLARNNLVAY
eukprot:6173601-Pleurochrysis_carterae.AAC.1